MPLPVVLVTGFEPFDDAPSNPSGDVALRIAESGHAGVEVVALVLPVSFARATPLLGAAINEVRPDIVISLGLANGRLGITPERVAINLADARIADNDGAQPRDAEIEPGGPAARFTTLPVKAIAHALEAAGITSSVSLSAGSYVGNQLFYGLMGTAGTRPGMRAGFVHVPSTPELGGPNTMTLDEIERGVRLAITQIVSRTAESGDLDAVGGTTH
jgi:pyroglutamyl-peptidase